jgi:septum formation protein
MPLPIQMSFWPTSSWPDKYPQGAILKRSRGKLVLLRKVDKSQSHLILASGSKSKARILSSLGLSYTIMPANVDESLLPSQRPEQQVIRLATMKATSIASYFTDGVVVGADTLIFFGNHLIGKPGDDQQAFHILSELSGGVHSVITGMCLIDCQNRNSVCSSALTLVHFRSLSESTIIKYIRTGEPIGKAGAYSIQGKGALLVERVDGEYTNGIGLPISTFINTLDQLGYIVL